MLWLNPSVDSGKTSVHYMNAGDDGFSAVSSRNVNDSVVDLTLPTYASINSTYKAQQRNTVLSVRVISNISRIMVYFYDCLEHCEWKLCQLYFA